MKLAVEFPSVSHREGAKLVARMAQGIEEIGYDHIDIFDHVVMGYDVEGRSKSLYSPKMPILEVVSALSFIAGVTELSLIHISSPRDRTRSRMPSSA